MEPVGITLAALALLDPTIKACRNAYGELEAERARLELALDAKLTVKPEDSLLQSINAELGAMSESFQACQDLVVSIDGHQGISTSTALAPGVDTQNLAPDDVGNSSLKPRGKGAWMKRLIPFTRSKSPSATTVSKSSHRNAVSDGTRESGTTLDASSTLPPSVQETEAMTEGYRQRLASERFQERASLFAKAKWTLGQRNTFLRHLDNLHASNDMIKDILSMRALTGIYEVEVEQKVSGAIPNDVLAVNSSLLRLHRAMVSSNRTSEVGKQLLVSLKILKAADYVVMRERIPLHHDYLQFREDSAVFPLQIGPRDSVPYSLVLAETTNKASNAVESPSDRNRSISELLQPQDPKAEESLRLIGSIETSDPLTDLHRLFQDINTPWDVNSTIEGMIETAKRHMTYVGLAVQLAISYMYIVSFRCQHFPGLADYRYYTPQVDNAKSLQPHQILEPYLTLGFGSKPPKQSTANIGGLTSRSLLEDEAMARLGLILHQVGRWEVLKDQGLATARETARMRRNELLGSTNISFTQVVDFCLRSKLESDKPEAQAESIYRNVVEPLQRIAEDLKFD